MASMRDCGVVGVVSRTSSKPAAVATSRIGPVSSRGISGTRRPVLTHHRASLHLQCAVRLQVLGWFAYSSLPGFEAMQQCQKHFGRVITPAAPAALICWQNVSGPRLMMML